MNYARYADWIRDRVEDLVGFGIPRADAESLMALVEQGGIKAEADIRADRQFLLDFERMRSTGLASRNGKSRQAMCQKRAHILATRKPEDLNPELTARLTAA